MEMQQDPSTILSAWESNIVNKNLTNDEYAVYEFIMEYFKIPAGTDISSCIPIDYNSKTTLPLQLKNKISNPKLQTFASSVYQLWQYLCKQINSNVYIQPKRHSLIALPFEQMIVAGGRFREVYYWELR